MQKNTLLLEMTEKEIMDIILKDLKEFRKNHWDDSLPIDKAYKKYMKLAEPFLQKLP